MFGPNVKSDERGIYYHHRETQFHEVMKSLKGIFAHKFGLEEYDFLFLTGSGTTANETIIFSLGRAKFRTLFADAEFGRRLRKMVDIHSRSKSTGKVITAYPLYETSISRYNLHKLKPKEHLFLDMVSAFPYYLPPKGTDIWTTVSSKQLGAYPVLGIIAIHENFDIGSYVCNYGGSSLNLLGHRYHQGNNETLVTAALPLYYDLLQTLQNFDREKLVIRIDQRRKKIESIVGIENMYGCGPVVTFRKNARLNLVFNEFNLYKSDVGRQIFLWSGKPEEYEDFYTALRKAMK